MRWQCEFEFDNSSSIQGAQLLVSLCFVTVVFCCCFLFLFGLGIGFILVSPHILLYLARVNGCTSKKKHRVGPVSYTTNIKYQSVDERKNTKSLTNHHCVFFSEE